MITVYAYVVADLLHHGHIRHLERARKLGDRLVVGVLTDAACIGKKPLPIMSLAERMKVVKALRCVYAVVTQDTYSPLSVIKTLRPDILAESTSHKKQPANKFVERHGGKVVVLPYTNGISSTMIRWRVINAYKKAQHE